MRTRWGSVGAAWLAVAGCAACQGGVGVAPDVTLRDSAGIRIVESAIERGRLPVFAEVGIPDLTIGVIDGDPQYTFGFVTDVRGLSDGGVAVSDYQDLTIRVYDREGVHRLTLGGRGGGPGEFGMIAIAGVGRDGVRTWDAVNQRVTHFDQAGELVEAVTFRQDAAGQPFEVHRLSDGTYLARSRYRELDALSQESPSLKVTVDSLVLRRLDSRGADLDTIVVAPAEEFLREVWDDGRGGSRPVGAVRPFGAATFWVAHDDGTSTTVRSTTLELVNRDRDGTVRMIARLLDPPQALDLVEVERLKGRRLEEVRNNLDYRRLVERVFDRALLPDYMPRVSALKTDSRGNYWVAEFATFPEAVTEWLVFAPSGEVLGRVSFPEHFVVHDIGADHVLGVWSDDLDVQYVRRYPLARVH